MTPEEALVIPCAGEWLVAIHHRAAAPGPFGVVIVVGGPQYRVGSHRQFVVLARRLAAHGVPVLRFDYRGMGDSTGAMRTFEEVDADIRAAVDALLEREPALRGVVLWGLCDAASAIAMYAHTDDRVAGVVLANPWVHTEAGEARTRLRHYYLSRLRSGEFWQKLAGGRLDWRDTCASFAGYLRRAFRRGGVASGESRLHYVERMRRGLAACHAPVYLVLSGDDLTAREFRDLVEGSPAWAALLREKVRDTFELPEANHTFARGDWKAAVAERTLEWVQALSAAGKEAVPPSRAAAG